MRPACSVDTDADREKVQAFLAEHPPHGWYGLGRLGSESWSEQQSPRR